MSPSPKSRLRTTSLTLGRASTGDALRRGDIKISDPIPIPREADGFGPQTLPPQSTDSWPRGPAPVPEDFAHPNGSHHGHHTSDSRISAYNTTASLSTHPSKTSLTKQRGGLRATIKRIFGGKKKRDTITSIVEEPQPRQTDSFISTAEPISVQRRTPRSSSMPIQEVTRHSALGSHAPDVFESNENDTDRRTLQRNSFDGTYYLKRRNTFGDSGIGAGEALATAQKRRSRSAGNLRQLASPLRNRDEEIDFWRKSMRDSPLQACTPDRPATRDTTESQDPPHTAASTDYTPDSVQQSSENTPTLHLMPSQTFDFGNLVNINSEDTVEQRLTTVEVKLMDLEMAMARLSDHDVGKRLVLDKPPPGRRSARQSKRLSVASSDAVDMTFLGSAQSSPSAALDMELSIPSVAARLNRSSAATTVRPSTAVRRSVAESQVSERPPSYATIEHIEKLMILLQREQSNRHKLELQVKSLMNQLDQLQRSPPYAHFKANSYPTPSPEDRPGGPPPSNHAVISKPRMVQIPKFRDDASIQTDTDDGFLDVYQTPTENKEHKFSAENLRAQQPNMAGMI